MCVGRVGKGDVEAWCQIFERRKVKDACGLEVRPPPRPSVNMANARRSEMARRDWPRLVARRAVVYREMLLANAYKRLVALLSPRCRSLVVMLQPCEPRPCGTACKRCAVYISRVGS
jgi:hypothetical protein